MRDGDKAFRDSAVVRICEHLSGSVDTSCSVDDHDFRRALKSQFADRGGRHLTGESDVSNETLERHRTDPAGLGDSPAYVWELHFGGE